MKESDARIGMRVRLSGEYLKRHKSRGSLYGTVVGFGHATKTPNAIRVRRDGAKSANTWAASFWEPCEDGVECGCEDDTECLP